MCRPVLASAGQDQGVGTTQRFISWPARLLFGALASVNVPMFSALVVANPPEPLPIWLKVIAAVAVGGLAAVTARVGTMQVIVTKDEDVVVRSVVRTTRVPARTVKAVLSPDWDAIAAIPRLVMDDGSSVKLTPILRVKNRAWGVDKTARRNMESLADRLDVPVQRGDQTFRSG